jgi:hypothetical protein
MLAAYFDPFDAKWKKVTETVLLSLFIKDYGNCKYIQPEQYSIFDTKNITQVLAY